MTSYRDILNFEVIQEFVKKLTGTTIDEDLKEIGFKELEEKYSTDEIYEKEATDIEQELIKIYLDLLEEKGVKVRKRIRIPMPMSGKFPPTDSQSLKKFLKEFPELRKLIEEILDEDDDDDYEPDDDRARDMYI